MGRFTSHSRFLEYPNNEKLRVTIVQCLAHALQKIFLFWFFETKVSVVLEPALELALIDQTGFELRDSPVSECWN